MGVPKQAWGGFLTEANGRGATSERSIAPRAAFGSKEQCLCCNVLKQPFENWR